MEIYAFGKTLNKGSRKLNTDITSNPLKTFAKNSKDPTYNLEFLKYKYTTQVMKQPAIMDIMTSGLLKPVDAIGNKSSNLISKDTIYGKGWTFKVDNDSVTISGQKYDNDTFENMVRKALLYPNNPSNQIAKAIVNRTAVGVQILKLISERNQPLFKDILKMMYPSSDIGDGKIDIRGTKKESPEKMLEIQIPDVDKTSLDTTNLFNKKSTWKSELDENMLDDDDVD